MRALRSLLAPAALAAAACGSFDGPTTVTELKLLQVESVEVRVGATAPASVIAVVHGFLADGCSSVGTIEQVRQGNTVTVTIAVVRRGEVCLAAVSSVAREIPLEGTFPRGDYLLRVNGAERAFRVS